MPDHTSTIPALFARLQSHPDRGLSHTEAGQRLARHGANRLDAAKERSLPSRLLAQFRDAMVVILLGAAAISFAVAWIDGSGEYLDAVIIVAIVLLNAFLSVRQEGKAEQALQSLQELSAPTAKAVRDGQIAPVPTADLVPGDVVLLEAGDAVPADGRLVESASLACEESALTGESLPAQKESHASVAVDAPLGDRRNMVFSGCSVTYGRGRMLVTRTGMDTEMGKIAELLQRAGQEATPLQQKLNRMGRTLGIVAIGICAAIFAIGLFQGLAPMEMFLTAVSLAVAAIPEGLTAVVTVVLALGVQRMVRHGAIVRRLPAVETLGSASVICSDKTGTLTQNRMTLRKLWTAGGHMAEAEGDTDEATLHLLRLAALCCDGHIAVVDGREQPVGDPTETAIVAAAGSRGLDKEQMEAAYPRVGEVPFDSQRKRMSTVHRVGDRILVIVKGGVDGILPLCPGADGEKVEAANRAMAGDALRVLAVACKEIASVPERPRAEELESGLVFMGLIGMIDPPRTESAEAVALCRGAGIRTVMITGDHVVTASAIARDLGILEHDAQAITGMQLASMSREQLERQVDRYRVYARVSPEDKIRIVEAWQARGAVVAMTGDGVNDAPALKAADIGCAMGVTGTDVAKGAADMVLTDDNFSTIVEAVRSGRGIYDNITKTIRFLLGSNLGEVLVVFVAMVLGWGAPLLAIHLLLVNVVTDALPALALGVEPVEKDILSRPPVPRDRSLLAGGLGVAIVLQGLMIGVLSLAGYYVGRFVALSPLHPPSPQAGMTMTFLVLSLCQLTQAMNCRSGKSLFRIGFGSNRKMLWAVLGSALVVTAICLVPPLERAFHMVDLSMLHWFVVLGLAVMPLVLAEIGKAAVRIIHH